MQLPGVGVHLGGRGAGPGRPAWRGVPVLSVLHLQAAQSEPQEDGGVTGPVVTAVDDAGLCDEGQKARSHNKVIQS